MSAGGIEWRGWEKMKARLDKLAGGYGDAAARCAGLLGQQVIADAINEVPTVPIDTGRLRRSGTFEVIPDASWRRVMLQVGFNTAYAARVHQVPMQFREPGSGNYFLSAKLDRHRREYVESWARRVTRALGM